MDVTRVYIAVSVLLRNRHAANNENNNKLTKYKEWQKIVNEGLHHIRACEKKEVDAMSVYKSSVNSLMVQRSSGGRINTG